MVKLIDLSGKRFGRLTVCRRSDKKTKSHATYWICKCDCGRGAIVQSNCLVHGITRSCGCLRKEMARKKLLAILERKLTDKSKSNL